MSLDPTLGQLMEGGSQLNLIPPNASHEDQLVLINNAIIALNNFSRDVVAKGSVSLTLATEASKVLVVPHQLGYKPRAAVYLDNVNITVGADTYPNVNFPLPTYTNAGADGLGHILFGNWIDFFVDATNLYIHYNSGTNDSGTIALKYFLTRDAAN